MSKEQIKYEINKVLDNFSDSALQELLAFLKDVEAKDNSGLFNSQDLHRILSEDKELLQRLAK